MLGGEDIRDIIKEFVAICAETLPIEEPVYEFGSFQVPDQIGYADLRPFFKGKKYVGADMREGPGVDVVLDLHKINLPTESVGTVLTLDTLEHVEYPRKAVDEIRRILKPNGIAIISSVMKFPIHDYPYDYWRYTPEAFRSLLREFADSMVDFCGDEEFPHTVVGIGFKGGKSEFPQLRKRLDNWKVTYKQYQDIPSKRRIRQMIPPYFMEAIRKVRRG